MEEKILISVAVAIILAVLTVITRGIKNTLTRQTAKLDRYIKKLDHVAKGTQNMLHSDIFRNAKGYIAKNEITVSELKDLEYLHKEYKALGGNGVCDGLVKRCHKLPLKKGD